MTAVERCERAGDVEDVEGFGGCSKGGAWWGLGGFGFGGLTSNEARQESCFERLPACPSISCESMEPVTSDATETE